MKTRYYTVLGIHRYERFLVHIAVSAPHTYNICKFFHIVNNFFYFFLFFFEPPGTPLPGCATNNCSFSSSRLQASPGAAPPNNCYESSAARPSSPNPNPEQFFGFPQAANPEPEQKSPQQALRASKPEQFTPNRHFPEQIPDHLPPRRVFFGCYSSFSLSSVILTTSSDAGVTFFILRSAIL